MPGPASLRLAFGPRLSRQGSLMSEIGASVFGCAHTPGYVIGAHATVRRIGGHASVFDVSAARRERAARGELNQRWRHPGNGLNAMFVERAVHGRSEEPLRVGVAWRADDGVHRPHFRETSGVH